VKDPELQRVQLAKRIKREYVWRRECKAHEDRSGFSTERQEKTPNIAVETRKVESVAMGRRARLDSRKSTSIAIVGNF